MGRESGGCLGESGLPGGKMGSPMNFPKLGPARGRPQFFPGNFPGNRPSLQNRAPVFGRFCQPVLRPFLEKVPTTSHRAI